METVTEAESKNPGGETGNGAAAENGAARRRWYVVHTYSGYEQKAKAALDERVKALRLHDETRALGERFGEILVPVERVQELGKGGQRRISSRKFFPGYIFVNMELDDETWHIVKNTPKVTGFVGHATNPPEVPESEVREITQQMEEGALRPKPKVLFEVGEAIKVVDGPFQDFNGTVEEVRPEKGKVRVLISIFGRATPVELDFVQVEKS
ncbi:MAG: transcription termination/antitermination protein NusG [Candidatus Binataceae bacterium]